jgi:hypothetical protein
MSDCRSAFEGVLYERLIPEFCGDSDRRCETSDFRGDSVRISAQDASYFVMAWEAGLIEHQGRGLYRAAGSAASEQFFWTGPRASEPRWFSLWIEPVITVAALARLHFDFGWPKHLIGTQSVDWAFDVVTFLPGQANEFIAGEVKKTRSEVDHLIRLMAEFGRNPRMEVPTSGKARNAYKKVAGLRARRAPMFWAIGPDGLSKAYRVRYHQRDVVELVPADDRALRFPPAN